MNLNFSIKDLWDRLNKEFISKEEYRNKDIPSKTGGVATVTKLYTSDNEMNMDTNVPDGTIGVVSHYGWRTMQEIVEDAGGDYDNTYVDIPDISGTDADKADIKWINPDFGGTTVTLMGNSSELTWEILYYFIYQIQVQVQNTIQNAGLQSEEEALSMYNQQYPKMFTDNNGNSYSLYTLPNSGDIAIFKGDILVSGGGVSNNYIVIASANNGLSSTFSEDAQEWFYPAMAQLKNMNWIKTYVSNIIAALEVEENQVNQYSESLNVIFYNLFTCPAAASRTLYIKESGKWTNIQNTIPFDSVEEMHKYTAKDGDIGVVDNWSWVEVTDDNTAKWEDLPLVNISGTVLDKGTAKSHIFYCKDTVWDPVAQEYPNINDFEHAGVFTDTNGKIWTLALADTYSVLSVYSDDENNINYFPVWLFDFDTERETGNPVEGDTGTVKLFLCSLGEEGSTAEDFSGFLSNLNAHLEYPVDWFNDAYCLASGNYTFSENDGWIADSSSVYARPYNFPNIINMIDEETSAFTDGVTVLINSFVSDFFSNLDMGIHLPKHTKGSYERVNDKWKEKGSSVTPITWMGLMKLRNNGKLVPGALYRITDYVTTTAQENTQSAGHQFDVIVRALDGSTLSEEAYAIQHDGDEYFANSKLEAWKVWYCLDNDKSRFAWADDSVDEGLQPSIKVTGGDTYFRFEGFDYTKSDKHGNLIWYYSWIKGRDTIYTRNEVPEEGAQIYLIEGSIITTSLALTVVYYTPAHEGTGLPNGRGVIYRLIDEFNNDIKYDFKNIQFKRTITDGAYDENGTETWCYTLNVWHENMCKDASIVGNTLPNDDGFVAGVYDNVFGYTTAYNIYIEGVNTLAFALGDNVVLSLVEDDCYYGTFSNIVGDNFYFNTIGNSFHSNIIGNYVHDNIINTSFNSNTIGNHFRGNTIGPDFEVNAIGNHFADNIIGDDFHLNTIGHKFVSNIIGNYVHDNIVGNSFHSSIIGNHFTHNTIGNDFANNTIGTRNGDTVTTKDYVRYIRVEDGVQYTNITTSATTSEGAYLQNIIIGKGVAGTSSNRKTITHPTANDTKQTTYVPTNSTTVNV